MPLGRSTFAEFVMAWLTGQGCSASHPRSTRRLSGRSERRSLCRPGTATNVMRVLTDSKVPEPVSRSARTWSRASSGTHCSHRRRVGAMSSPGGEGIWLVFKAAPDSGGVAGPVPAMPDDGDLDAAAAHGMPGQGPITQWLAGTTPPSGPCLCRGSSPPGLTALTRRTDHTARRPGRGAASSPGFSQGFGG